MSTTNPYGPGDYVPFNFDAGIIVASYIVSLIGSITTVELLHRKQEGTKWYSSRWLNQFAVSVSFGLVAIWCMHFVGNRAIILGNGDDSLQLYYNSGFTALSAFIPIIVLFIGLTTVEVRQPGQRYFWPALLVAGTVAGLAIVGMHYIGNFGINNYRLHFPVGYVLGAVAIAIGASIAALSLFFYFQERWINSPPRRFACALLLAGAVSGMHWVASVGTQYERLNVIPGPGTSRNTNLIVAIVISLVACIICLCFAFLTQKRKRELADRAQHVVLASATFDSEGRLLVTQEGLMPSQKITKQYNQRSFNDEFDIAHPVFQWLYRITFNWSGIVDLIPAMRHHLRVVGIASNDPARPVTPGADRVLSTREAGDPDVLAEEYSILFREYFCVAAAELAENLKTSIQDIGVLYNEIMSTGSLAAEFQPFQGGFRRHRQVTGGDIESGMISNATPGKGQLLFLVRQADKQEAARLISDGFRFAQPAQVADIIARSMRVSQSTITQSIDKLRKYGIRKNETLPAAVYLAAFVMRPTIKASSQGWDILVPTQCPTQLPMVDLSDKPLNVLQQKILNRLDGLTINQTLAYLNNSLSESPSEEEREWTEQLLDQVSALVVDVPEQFFGYAVFSSTAVKVEGVGTYDSMKKAADMGGAAAPLQVYAFSIIPDIHSASIKSINKVMYVPLSFFRCSQRVYKGSRDHAILARKIHREFATVLAEMRRQHPMAFAATRTGSRRGSTDKTSSMFSESVQGLKVSSDDTSAKGRPISERIMELPIVSSLRAKSPMIPGSRSASRQERHSDGSSEAGLVANSSSSGTNGGGASFNPLGGIMVSSDTTVEVQPREVFEMKNVARNTPGTHSRAPSSTKKLEMRESGMGIRSEAGVGSKEEPTYVDELYRTATMRWTKER